MSFKLPRSSESLVRSLTPVLIACLAAIPAATSSASTGGTLSVITTSPLRAVLDASTNGSISVTFDRPVDPDSIDVTSFHAFSRGAGSLRGEFLFSADGHTVTLDPIRNASPGEPVTVTLANSIRGTDRSTLRSAGYQFRFWTAAAAAEMDFFILQEITTSAFPGEVVVPYGGSATDLDEDGWIDLSIVNEETDDVRVFLNTGDGTGRIQPFLTPTNSVGSVPSPSEPADFDLDGHADLCTANITGDNVSILIGGGDGSYGGAQTLGTGNAPRGITTLDLDGDGYLDIASTNYSSGNVTLLRNQGNGIFDPPTTIQPGISGEWSIQADDLNGDGIFDLVVGGANQIRVLLADGNGNFISAGTRSVAGRCWQLNLADLDGDGDVDVTTVNSFANAGQVFRNDGSGGLANGVTYSTDPFPLASDLGDLDGDGDLDWITSSYSGDWFLFVNDGAGNFTFRESFPSPIAASCSLPVDMDNDGDLDLIFVDELDDSMIVMSNGGNNTPDAPGDLNGDGLVNGADLGLMLVAWGACNRDCQADLDQNGFVDGADLGLLLVDWTG
jgi:hypothetical protein